MSVQTGADQALRSAVDGRCAWVVGRDTAAEALTGELDRWLDPSTPSTDLDGLTLARLVTHEVRWVGKHALERNRLQRLSAVRVQHAGRDRCLDAFLDCVLDKHEGRFWNRTYLFLPVLEDLVAEHDLSPSVLAALLTADVIRYELCAAHRLTDVSPLGRPDPRTLRTRLRHALRFTTSHLGGAGSEELLAAVAHDPEADLPTLVLLLPRGPIALAGAWLELTVQCVSTVHDEYFFVRVLQAHEMSFAAMNHRARAAVAAIRDSDTDLATVMLHELVSFMDRNASLFRIIATMRPEAFHTFRELTDGASAIQSEQYKRFEGLCGTPPAARLASPGFDSVPTVRAEVLAGQDSLTDAYRDACTAGRHRAELAAVADLLRTLEDSHRRWKSTHVTLASRMLGDARGSGHTSGVGYLQEWVEHRLFWQLPDIGVSRATRRSR